MALLSFLRRREAPRRVRSAAFPAAALGRLTSSFTTDPGAINRWLRYELRTMRARSRELVRGEAYAAGFVDKCVTNIAGPRPFFLQAKVKFGSSGELNATANTAIEQAWRAWSRPGGCEVTGKLSLGELDRLVVRCIARDGEVLIRKVQNDPRESLRLQLLDIDRLDEQRNENLPDGAIKMGVEVDRAGKPRAYHILREHPGELGEWTRGSARESEPVRAADIWHLFVADWPEQVRGVPWMHAAMIRLWNLGGFEDAAVIAARVGATQMGFITTPDGAATSLAQSSQPAGEGMPPTPVINAEPATFPVLAQGQSIEAWDPKYPDAAVEPFIRACLRGAAAGCKGMAYHNFANDLSGVNFTSGRLGERDERDMWMAVQDWYVDHYAEPRAAEWLRIEVLRGTFPLAYAGYREYLRFQPKRWPHIQPREETEANIAKLDHGLTSPQAVITAVGDDPEEILDDIAAWQKMLKARGLVLAADQPKPAPAKPSNGAAEDDGEDPPETGDDDDDAQPARLFQ